MIINSIWTKEYFKKIPSSLIILIPKLGRHFRQKIGVIKLLNLSSKQSASNLVFHLTKKYCSYTLVGGKNWNSNLDWPHWQRFWPLFSPHCAAVNTPQLLHCNFPLLVFSVPKPRATSLFNGSVQSVQCVWVVSGQTTSMPLWSLTILFPIVLRN